MKEVNIVIAYTLPYKVIKEEKKKFYLNLQVKKEKFERRKTC